MSVVVKQMCACVMTLLRNVVMCDSQPAQMIDNRAQSMLGNEISCSSAHFVGL